MCIVIVCMYACRGKRGKVEREMGWEGAPISAGMASARRRVGRKVYVNMCCGVRVCSNVVYVGSRFLVLLMREGKGGGCWGLRHGAVW